LFYILTGQPRLTVFLKIRIAGILITVLTLPLGYAIFYMEINTASAAISLAKKLEEDSTKFYEDLSQRYPKGKDAFLSFVKENRKNVIQIERAY